jgi:HKD family nuclease
LERLNFYAIGVIAKLAVEMAFITNSGVAALINTLKELELNG